MTRYKLNPAVFDLDEEYEATPTFDNHGRYRVAIPGYEPVLVPASMLVKVEPPLPPEPPNGSVLRTRTLSPAVYQRSDQGCDTEGAWWATGDEVPVRWEAIAHIEFERLVPAPERVELPWLLGGVQVQQTTDNDKPSDRVLVSTKNASYGFAHLQPDMAREMARALWTAADQAEAAGVAR